MAVSPVIALNARRSAKASPRQELPKVADLSRPPRVALLFPPNWTPTMPHLALPSLTAYLRQMGVAVMQRDLNAEVFDYILTPEYLRRSVAAVRRRWGSGSARARGVLEAPSRETVDWALTRGPELVRSVAAATDVVRSPAFYDGPEGFANFQILADCLELASLPFHPAHLHLQSYEAARPVDSSRNLLFGVSDRDHNMFLDIYEEIVLEDLEAFEPDVVGISIPSEAQVLAGFTLAHLVQEAGIDCHVTVGGPHISMLHDVLPKQPALFELIDSAVVYDGEIPLYQLACAVVDGGDLDGVPNLIYRKGRTLQVTERKEPEKIRNLPLPDFDGFPLDRYLAPELVLPLMTARGCYFGQCAFCNVGYGEAESFSQLTARSLADQMLTLREKYGTRHIFFADEAITPRNLRGLSAILREEDEPLHWGGCVRFEKVIDQSLLDQMWAGGCRMIMFGLESASQAIIDHMIKGTELPHMSRILKESATAGIWNHTFFFFGFPGETLDDAQQTVNFIYAHGDQINSAAMGTFLMERLSPAYRYPASFGVSRIIEDPARDLAIYFPYEVSNGLDEAMAERVHDGVLDSLPTKPFPHFYVSDVYRFLYAGRLSLDGRPNPAWLAPAAAA
ncbi:MAG: radical SAM protein [Caldilineaceae bacterium]|nr:radical SAM protein [Caldilineaceae bacterium]